MKSEVDFLILGAAKSGTTALAQDLSFREDVFIPEVKEVEFFSSDKSFARGSKFYESHFKGAPTEALVGDASPQYLYRDVAAERIRGYFPDQPPKMVVMLRNPIARAYSSYWQARAIGGESRSFEDAIREERNRIHRQPSDPSGRTLGAFVGAGLYGVQLARYLNLFPLSSFLVIISEEYRSEPSTVRPRIASWLGLTRGRWSGSAASANVARLPKSSIVNQVVRGAYPGRASVARILPRVMRHRIKNAIDRRNMETIRTPPLSRDQFNRLHEIFLPDVQNLTRLLPVDLAPWGGLDLNRGLRIR